MISYSTLFLIKFFAPKVLVATVCGFLVGVEREMKNKAAGIRTNILICVGVALFTSTACLLAQESANVDVTRIIGQIITGVGFLGTGVIYRFENKISGVTTASFIWIISAIGVLIGCDFLLLSLILTVGLLVMIYVFGEIERIINQYKENKDSKNE